MSDNDESVASAETLAAAESSGTVASSPSPNVRAGRRSILPVGTVVGRYVLAERIGAGGMGTVYRAHDPKLARDVAVKLVSSIDLEAAQAYLEREAQAMAQLSHPNVAIVHDIGTWNEQLFIAMELCGGGSLAKWLVEPRPWRAVVTRFVAAGRGLAAAHRIGLVHRDFKPDNVLIANDGTVKVSDFGLVRSSTGIAPTDSNPDAIEGTPVYMAPEQLAGDAVDARADQFSFAVSVWEGVCGGRPFQPEGGTRDLVDGMLRAIRARRLMRGTTSKVPRRVIAILERGLAANPADRWPSLDDMIDALERAARPMRKWLVGVAGAAVVAVVATIVVMRVTAPESDLSTMPQAIEHAVAPIYVGAGDIAIAKKRGDMNVASPDDFADAVAAYDIAFTTLGEPRLRLKLAHALRGAGRCSEALAQLDTYLRNGGRAKISEMGQQVFLGADEYIDFEWLLRLKAECEDDNHLARTPEQYRDLAMQLYRQGHGDRAFKLLEEGFHRFDDYSMLQQMGDIRRMQGLCNDARMHYEAYAKYAPPEVPQSWRDKVKHMADDCVPVTP